MKGPARLAILLLTATLFLIPISAAAQVRTQPVTATISGRVIVPMANFQDIFEVLLVQNLEQPVQATVADRQGRYRFAGLTRGTYYVVVKLDGFQDVRQRVDVAGDMTVNIIMDFQEERTVKPPTDFSGEELGVVDVAELSRTYPPRLIEALKAVEKDIQVTNYAKALLALEEIIHEAPDLYPAQRIIGMVYQKLGRYRDAESAYKTAADLRPTSAAPLINLGSLYIEEAQANESKGSAVVRGILNEALASLNEAVKLKPDASFAYYLLGVTYYKSAFYEEAEDHLKHALDLAPDLFDARLALANVYLKMLEWSNVIIQLDRYLLDNPKSPVRDQVLAMRSKVVARSQANLHR